MTFFLEAFLLSLASSTDNFMVGLSVGIGNRSLSFGVNALISVCNATGAWLAGFGGSVIGQQLPSYVSPFLSAIAFGGLALKEFWEFYQTARRKRHVRVNDSGQNQTGEENFTETNNSSENNVPKLDITRAMQLAIPMTLNNLAGGVAGGAIGVTPLQAGIFGFFASFVTMATGHRIGLHLATLSNKGSFSRQRQHSSDGKVKHDSFFSQCHLLLDPSFASGSLLGILCLVSIQELLAI